jgi:predicted ATP-dependent endonuclease of OLD family
MVLKKLVIEDFLSIRGKIEIHFDRNVTIFLGANDHGKSNILRALSCLNEESPINSEDKNWDAEAEPSLLYQFEMTSKERADFELRLSNLHASYKERIEQYKAATAQKTEEDVSTEEATAAKAVAVAAQKALPAKSAEKVLPSVDEVDDETKYKRLCAREKAVFELRARVALAPSLLIDLKRSGVESPLSFEGEPVKGWDAEIREFLLECIPRVEVFQPNAGALQDSVTADQIATEEFEFLQGVFFYADIDPRDCKDLFVQNDTTERRLDRASDQLDAELRRIWGQGVFLKLHFELRHRNDAIEFLANDPAVKSRKTRMSKRSAGVTQFFRLSMVLHARRQKHPANSYIFLFDEPGIYLHPKGQKDLIQVFEQLSAQTQIAYATHSLFLLNQNFPERHRLIVRDEEGTKVDQKPYRANWRYATDALGVHLTANILFSPSVLLVEGDSDPIYIYELIRQLNHGGKLDADANMLGIFSYENLPNLRFLLQTFKQDSEGTKVMVLCDGDKQGKQIQKAIQPLCDARNVPVLVLNDKLSIEDYTLEEECFLDAVLDTIATAAEAASVAFSEDDKKRAKGEWDAHLKQPQTNTGAWFKRISGEFLKDKEGASKVGLARNYAFRCREKPVLKIVDLRQAMALELSLKIVRSLELPATRAPEVIETKSGGNNVNS